ncbi:MAG: hypothetical protein AAGA21_16340 [Pseudomonadota bacterium]
MAANRARLDALIAERQRRQSGAAGPARLEALRAERARRQGGGGIISTAHAQQDPEAALALAQQEPGFLDRIGSAIETGKNVTSGIADMLSFGLMDEAVAAVGAPFVGWEEARRRVAEDMAPTTDSTAYKVGQVAGAVTAPATAARAVLGRKAFEASAGVLPRILKGAGIGAAEAGAYGFGSAEGDLQERARSAAGDAAVGAAIGGPLGILNRVRATPRVKEDALAAQDLNILLTRGQMTDDLATLKAEENVRQTGGAFADPLRRFEGEQADAIDAAARGIVPSADDIGTASARGIEDLTAAHNAQKAEVRAAYDAASKQDGSIAREAFNPLVDRMRRSADEFAGFDPVMRERLTGIVDNLSEAVSTKPGVSPQRGVSIAEVEGLRKNLNSTLASLKGPDSAAARAGVQKLKGDFDAWMDDVVDSSLFSGDEKALNAIKDARGLHRQFKQRFGNNAGDPAGRIVDKLLDESVSDSVNALFGKSTLGLSGTAEAVRRIKSASPEAFGSFKQAAWQRIIQDPQGNMKTAGNLSNAIEKHLNQFPELMDELFESGEIGQMRKLVKALAATKTPAKAMNPPRSGWTMLEGLQKSMFGAGLVGSVAAGPGFLALSAPLAKSTLRDFMTTRRALGELKLEPGVVPRILSRSPQAAGRLSVDDQDEAPASAAVPRVLARPQSRHAAALDDRQRSLGALMFRPDFEPRTSL